MSPERFDFKQAMESLLPKAWEELGRMLMAEDFEERRFAIQTVMDRTQGKAVERKELTGANGAAIQIEDSTPAIRLLLQQVIEHETKVLDVKGESDDV